MAQERTLGIAPGREEEPSKEELQRRMEQARDSISTTVNDIKETVANQVENVKDALDWREHFKRAPVAWSLGAAGVGFLAGYGFVAVVKGDPREDYRGDYYEPLTSPKSYSAQPVIGRQSISTQPESSSLTTRTGNGHGDVDKGPGLLERFKETSAYDRLSKEASSLGDRLVEELSSTAQTVVLPALLLKVKNWIGLDLSAKKQESSAHRSDPKRTAEKPQPSTYEPILERPS